MESNNSYYNKQLQSNAHALRSNMTKAEACLWKYALQKRMMRGYMFRRQRSIGNYIADFACLELKLVIEVDGITHFLYEDVQMKDLKKENDLKSLGYTVLRFKDEEVLRNIKEVVRIIESVIDELTSTPVLTTTPASGG